MAQRFNLTAQLQLQANSSNVNQVVNQLKKQLAPLGNVQLNVQANTKSLAQANQQMDTFGKSAKSATGSVGEFNRSLAESARRFSVITVATGSLLSLVNAFKKSTRAAIDFEYEMVKISQTTGQTMREVGAMSDEIRKLSTSLGVSSAELAGTARILLQAGLSAEKTRKSLDILAKTTLSASFDDIQSTTEGAIALINQFRSEAARAGGDVKFLEQSLDSINAVSKAFAVESADLVDVIRKVGGVFSNAGGSVNELISLFTSVRATTRESAETIGTGLRTIFTRIQRGDTVDALKELGIELRNSQGQFVGAFEAVKRLSEGLSSLDPRDFRFAAIVEELGGYRQIGKVIPLINQFSVAQQALNVAQNASGSIAADAQTSQQALAVQINKTKEKFNEFIASLTGSESFRSIITGALKLADAFINIGKALEPVLPLLTTLFALKAGQGLASGIGILRGFAGAPSGIRASKFASGGLVPGSGNRDTVPAMLTPGEFVIRKSSVNKLGASTLAQMNANGYMAGGVVSSDRHGYGTYTPNSAAMKTAKRQYSDADWRGLSQEEKQKKAAEAATALAQKANQQKIINAQKSNVPLDTLTFKVQPNKIGGFILNPAKGKDDTYVPEKNPHPFTLTNKRYLKLLSKDKEITSAPAQLDASSGFPTFYPGGRDISKISSYSRILDAGSKLGLKAAIENSVNLVQQAKLLDVDPAIRTDASLMKKVSSGLLKDQQVISTMSGYLFEGMIGALSGAIPAGGRSNFDFPAGSIGPNKEKLLSLFGDNRISSIVKAEAKRSRGQFTGADGVLNKTTNDINSGKIQGINLVRGSSSGKLKAPVKKASGGSISGSDTVPAMLTPGEFVVSKSAAQSIGYTNLNRMNKHGVQGYARGGVVGVQKFAQGGVAQQLDQLRGGTGAVSQLSIKEFAMLKQAAIKNTSAFEQLTGQLSGFTDVKAAKAALVGFTRNVDKVSDDTELVAKSLQSANKAIAQTEDANEQFARRLEQQQASDTRKSAGTSETRTAGSVTVQTGNFNQVQKDAAYAAGMFKATGIKGKELENALDNYKNLVNIGVSSQDALNQVIRTTTTEQQALNQSLTKKGQEQKKEFLGAPKYSGVGLGDKDSRAGFAQKSGEIAGSMQNFAFLGASVAAVTSQLGLFGDTTNKAIAETAGFTVGLVGIVGTLAQTLTSFGANSLAVQGNTTSITQNTAAQKGAAAANALGLVVIAAVAAVSALKFLSSQNKESAEAISKDRDARLKSAAETGVSSFKPGELQAGLEQELEMRQRSAEQMSVSSLKTVASFTAAGAGVGFLLGGPFGAAIGGAIGAAAGLGTALLDSESAVMEAAEARRREVEAIGKVYESYLQLSASSHKLSSTLNAIESTPGLSNQDKLERRMEAIATSSAGNDALRAGTLASNQLKTSAGRLGVTTEAASAMSPEEIAAAAKRNNPDLGEGDIADIQASVKASVATLKASADETARQIQETGKNLNDAAANLDLSGTTNAAQKTVAAYNQAIEAYVQSLERERDFKLSQVNSQDKNAVDAVNKETQIKINAAYAGRDATIKAKMAEAEANQRAVAAQIAMAEAARRTAVFLDSLADEKDTIKARSEALKDFTDTLSGGIVDLSTAIKPIRNIEEPSKITDAAKFSRQVQGVAQVSGSPEAQKAADELTNVAKLFEQANKSLIGKTLELEESIDAEKILKDIGLTPEALGGGDLGKSIFQQIAVTLRDQKTPITPEVLDKILAPLAERAKDSASIINEIQSVQQEEINLRQQQIQAEQMLREEQLSAISKYNSAVSSGSEALARATGQSVAAVRARNERESRQRTLNAGQASRGGRVLDATDPAQLAREKKAAQARTIEIINEIARLKQLGNTVKDLDGQLSKLQAEQKQLANVTKDASAALEEIASSSAEIDRLTEALDKERQVREQAYSVLKEFVVGGEDARTAITSGAMGILSAIQTGTTQNLSEEQRSQTFGLLDKLKDVMIGGTGLTGGQIANELVFRDAVRLGFPPDIAKELATQSTTEQLILEELRAQTAIQKKAAGLNTPTPFSKGGIVYRADGGSIQSKGTDTVPAMLTPGEYVVNARSAAKNMSLLKTINASRGGSVKYLKDGGIGSSSKLSGFHFTTNPKNYPEQKRILSKEEEAALNLSQNTIPKKELAALARHFSNKEMANNYDFDKNYYALEERLRRSGKPAAQGGDYLPMQFQDPLKFYKWAYYGSKISKTKNLEDVKNIPNINEALKQEAISSAVGFGAGKVGTGVLKFAGDIAKISKKPLAGTIASSRSASSGMIAGGTRMNRRAGMIKFGAGDAVESVSKEHEKFLQKIIEDKSLSKVDISRFINSTTPAVQRNLKNLYGPLAKNGNELIERLGITAESHPKYFNILSKLKDAESTARVDLAMRSWGGAGKPALSDLASSKNSINKGLTNTGTGVAGFWDTSGRFSQSGQLGNITESGLWKYSGEEEGSAQMLEMLYGKNIEAKALFNYFNKPPKLPITEQFKNLTTPTVSPIKSAPPNLSEPPPIPPLPSGPPPLPSGPPPLPSGPPKLPKRYYLGGVVYRADGGSIFKPRGTDTVPAMLTPGEFVIRKSAVDKIGVSNLAAINNGNASTVNKAMGGPIYRAAGGPVAGAGINSPINTNTATTAMATPGLNVLTGAAYRSQAQALINSAASTRKSATLIKFIKDRFGGVAANNVSELINAGAFEPNKFLARPINGMSKALDELNSIASQYFVSLDSTGGLLDPNLETVDLFDFWSKTQNILRNTDSALPSGYTDFFSDLGATKNPLRMWFDFNEQVKKQAQALSGMDFSTERNNVAMQPAPNGLGYGKRYAKLSDDQKIQVDEFIRKKTEGVAGKVGFAGSLIQTTGQATAQENMLGKKAADALNALRSSGLYLSGGGLVYMQSGGRAKYFNEGGNPADTIPAMLTPGEFVMSPEAVNKFGVGYMKSLNKGQVPGFRRGGLVGGGAVYRADGGSVGGGGGSLSIDSSNLQGILTNFSDTFKANLDNMITALSTVGGAINSLVSAFSAGMTINHQFSGDMTLAFNIQNGDVLKTQIAEAITPKLAEIITRELDTRLNKFKAG